VSGARLETVAFVYRPTELALLLSLFEHEKIWVVPNHYHQIAAQWHLTVALGGVELCVHEADAEAARDLLASLDRTQTRRCIFSENRLVEWLLILGLFAVGFFMPPARIPAHFLVPQGRVEARAE
jgi:hypothetical protein